MNINDIIHKEDSAERLAAVQGIEAKYLQSAEEFNCIVDNVKENNKFRPTLEPIVIYDPYNEVLSDNDSGLTLLTQHGFPTPINSYYNDESKKFYAWYTRDLLEGLDVQLNSVTGKAFGVDNGVSIEDKSGFIYLFWGNAFSFNYNSAYSNGNKLKVFYVSGEQVLKGSTNNIEIEQCYVNGSSPSFAENAICNIIIGNGIFTAGYAFQGVNPSDGNKVLIKHLDYVSGINFANGFGGKFVIESINTELLSACPADMFNTESPAILHLPFYAKGTPFGNYAEANIKASVPTNQVVYDGISVTSEGIVTTPSLSQVLAVGDRESKVILAEDTYNEVTNTYQYQIVTEDNSKALIILRDHDVDVIGYIKLNHNLHINGELVIYNERENIVLSVGDFESMPDYGDINLPVNCIVKVKRINSTTVIFDLSNGIYNESSQNKVVSIDTTLSEVYNRQLYPSVYSVLNYTGSLYTGLKPIVITDEYGEGFTDINSARYYLSAYNFPAPIYDYYNSDNKKYCMFYNSDYLGGVIDVGTLNGNGFGAETNLSIEDEEGFIGNYQGNVFLDNGNEKTNIIGAVHSNNDDAFSYTVASFKIKYIELSGSHNFRGCRKDIEIDNLYCWAEGCFDDYGGLGNGSKITIQKLQYFINGSFCENINGRVDIYYVDSNLFGYTNENIFKTDYPAIVHLPFYLKNTPLGDTILHNLTQTITTNKVIFDL